MKDDIQSNQELVAAFLLGDLEPEKRAAFETRLVDEPALREELELQQAVLEAGQAAQFRREFKEKIQAARQTSFLNESADSTSSAVSSRQTRFPGVWKMVALFLVAFLAGWIFRGLFSVPVPTDKPAPASPPVAQPGEEEDILVGAGRNSLKFNLPFVRLTQKTDVLEVIFVKDEATKAVVRGNEIILHFPAEQMPDERNMRLVEWMQDGERVLYLKIGEKGFRLREGEQALAEERDEQVLQRLKGQ